MKRVPKVEDAEEEEEKVQERRRAADSAIAELNLQQNFPKQSGNQKEKKLRLLLWRSHMLSFVTFQWIS